MKHYNPSIAEDATRIFNLKNGDMIPEDIGDPVAVIQISPMANIVRNIQDTATGTLTAYTTPTDKDFYLTGIQASYSKNAACDLATGGVAVTATIQGVSRLLAAMASMTLTAERDTVVSNFTVPIKIDRGVGITISGAFTAGAMSRRLTIIGYTVETTKGV